MSSVVLVLLVAVVGAGLLALLVGALFAVVYVAGSSGRREQLRQASAPAGPGLSATQP